MAKKNLNLGKLGSKREVIKQNDESEKVNEEEIINKIHKSREEKTDDLTRITVDVPGGLHTRMKMRVFSKRTTIRKYILELVEKDLDSQ